MEKRIGILGGTFDPVHFGHLRPALDVVEKLGLDQIRLVPCASQVHKAQSIATAEQRVIMLQLAIKNDTRFVVDDRELYREGPSYTVDTLVSLRQEFPDSPLFLFLGTDSFVSIHTWHNWQKISELVNIVIMKRPCAALSIFYELEDQYKLRLSSKDSEYNIAGGICTADVTQISISSTTIRKRMSEGLSLTFLLPDRVINLIEMLGLYKSKNE